MRGLLVAPLALAATGVLASPGIVYVTDLSIYTLLAPCAQSAVSYNIFKQTDSKCGQAVTDLQSCVCTKNQNSAAISSAISSDVSWSCGSTASDDQATAMAVYSQYCNPNVDVVLATPTGDVPVTAYVTDLPAFGDLASCAQNVVSYAVMAATYSICPQPASLLAPCVCQKNQNSLRMTDSISQSVFSSCSSNTADVSSAEAFFAAYCNMNLGTTAFPTPSNPPGDMTYFITALPQYSSLVPCARSGLSYGMNELVSSLCPAGPQAVASCACLKPGVSKLIMSNIASSVSFECDSTASEDFVSASGVFGYYCSAANNLVEATGVSQSVAQTYGTAVATGGIQTGPKPTGTGSAGSGSGSGSGNGSGPNSTKTPSTTVIIGGVVGVIAALVLLGLVALFFYRRGRQRSRQDAAAHLGGPGGGISMTDRPPTQHDGAPLYDGKAEIDGTAVTAYPAPVGSPQPSSLGGRTPRTDTVSPISPYGKSNSPYGVANGAAGPFAPPPQPQQQMTAELHDQPWQPMPSELQGNSQMAHHPSSPPSGYAAELQGAYGRPPTTTQSPPLPPELQGANAQGMYGRPTQNPPLPPELQGGYTPYRPGPQAAEAYGQQIHEAPGYGAQPQPQRAELQGGGGGMGWQSGPVGGYHEMDGGFHAR